MSLDETKLNLKADELKKSLSLVQQDSKFMQSLELANKGFKSLIYDQLVAQIELIEKLEKVF